MAPICDHLTSTCHCDLSDIVFVGPVTQRELIITWRKRRQERMKRERIEELKHEKECAPSSVDREEPDVKKQHLQPEEHHNSDFSHQVTENSHEIARQGPASVIIESIVGNATQIDHTCIGNESIEGPLADDSSIFKQDELMSNAVPSKPEESVHILPENEGTSAINAPENYGKAMGDVSELNAVVVSAQTNSATNHMPEVGEPFEGESLVNDTSQNCLVAEQQSVQQNAVTDQKPSKESSFVSNISISDECQEIESVSALASIDAEKKESKCALENYKEAIEVTESRTLDLSIITPSKEVGMEYAESHGSPLEPVTERPLPLPLPRQSGGLQNRGHNTLTHDSSDIYELPVDETPTRTAPKDFLFHDKFIENQEPELRGLYEETSVNNPAQNCLIAEQQSVQQNIASDQKQLNESSFEGDDLNSCPQIDSVRALASNELVEREPACALENCKQVLEESQGLDIVSILAPSREVSTCKNRSINEECTESCVSERELIADQTPTTSTANPSGVQKAEHKTSSGDKTSVDDFSRLNAVVVDNPTNTAEDIAIRSQFIGNQEPESYELNQDETSVNNPSLNCSVTEQLERVAAVDQQRSKESSFVDEISVFDGCREIESVPEQEPIESVEEDKAALENYAEAVEVSYKLDVSIRTPPKEFSKNQLLGKEYTEIDGSKQELVGYSAPLSSITWRSGSLNWEHDTSTDDKSDIYEMSEDDFRQLNTAVVETPLMPTHEIMLIDDKFNDIPVPEVCEPSEDETVVNDTSQNCLSELQSIQQTTASDQKQSKESSFVCDSSSLKSTLALNNSVGKLSNCDSENYEEALEESRVSDIESVHTPSKEAIENKALSQECSEFHGRTPPHVPSIHMARQSFGLKDRGNISSTSDKSVYEMSVDDVPKRNTVAGTLTRTNPNDGFIQLDKINEHQVPESREYNKDGTSVNNASQNSHMVERRSFHHISPTDQKESEEAPFVGGSTTNDCQATEKSIPVLLSIESVENESEGARIDEPKSLIEDSLGKCEVTFPGHQLSNYTDVAQDASTTDRDVISNGQDGNKENGPRSVLDSPPLVPDECPAKIELPRVSTPGILNSAGLSDAPKSNIPKPSILKPATLNVDQSSLNTTWDKRLNISKIPKPKRPFYVQPLDKQ